MDDDILLWHVSFDIERPLVRTYVPMVPKNPMPGEDITIPRICFAPSIEDCFNAMVSDRMERGLETGRFLAFPFRVAKDDPFLKTPEDIGDMVPDAYWTKEHWYLKPVTLAGCLMEVDDYEDFEFFDACERHRPSAYKILMENGVSSEDLAEFDGWDMSEVLANVPPWLSCEIALRLNIHQLHAFEWFSYRELESPQVLKCLDA